MDSKNVSPETVAKLCLQKYKELPKTGKPTNEQWSVLAGIVLYNSTTKDMRVVSLGLGTKCIGANKMCKNGFVVNDSHAEVLARRGLLRFIYNEIRQTNSTKNNQTIFAWNAKKLAFDLKEDFSFHFFSTQPPCGDACIPEELTEEPPPKLRKISNSSDNENGEILPTVYTGAKLFEEINENEDRMLQTIGALRIKPGKGDRTLSMSCSDKISKWCVMGVQGALLDSMLTTPLYLKTLNFFANTNEKALKRAFYERWKSKSGELKFETDKYKQHVPEIQICKDSSICFECQQNNEKKQPSPTGISWCEIPTTNQLKSCEVLVDGKRQGSTKKSIGTPHAAVHISKYHLFKEFDATVKAKDCFRQNMFREKQNHESMSYREAKNLSISYQNAWKIVKHRYFGQWTKKPKQLEDFIL